jgi:rhamnosyltransferase
MQSFEIQSAAIGAVVVTYRPSAGLLDNLQQLTRQIKNIILIDNGSGPPYAKLLEEAEKQYRVLVIRNERNLGIGAALNIGIRNAMDSGFKWVVTFDQDSMVTPDFFEAMCAAYEACPFKKAVAIIAPIICEGAKEFPSHLRSNAKGAFSLTRTAMTSGSLINTAIYPTVGFYDEGMFIDYVDYDFCLRLGKRGWKLLRAHRAFLLHQLGSAESHQFLGIKISIVSHSPWRRYHIMRNRVTIYRRYAFSAPLWCLHDGAWVFLELTKILLFEGEKYAKLKNMVKGITDGLVGKTGQLQQTTA